MRGGWSTEALPLPWLGPLPRRAWPCGDLRLSTLCTLSWLSCSSTSSGTGAAVGLWHDLVPKPGCLHIPFHNVTPMDPLQRQLVVLDNLAPWPSPNKPFGMRWWTEHGSWRRLAQQLFNVHDMECKMVDAKDKKVKEHGAVANNFDAMYAIRCAHYENICLFGGQGLQIFSCCGICGQHRQTP